MVGVRGFEPPAPCSQSRCATGLRHTPPARGTRVRLRSISFAQHRPGGARGERAVADALLLTIAQLAERPAEWRIKEHRVVAETAVAARRGRDRPLRDALHRALAAGLVDERDDAAKARGALLARHRAQTLERQRDAAGVVEPGAAEARRVQAGRATERVHLEAGVVGERRLAGQTVRRARLDERVLDIGGAGFRWQRGAGDLAQADQSDRQIAEQTRELAHLPRVQRCEDDMTLRGSDALEAEGSLAAGVERAALEPNEASDADAGETQQIVQACPIERRLLGGALDLDEFAGARHDHVHVHGGAAILYIVQVQDWAPADDADADRRHAVADGRADAGLAKGVGDRDEAAGDRGRARSAVRLDHVAVDPDGALAHLGALDHGAQGAADRARHQRSRVARGPGVCSRVRVSYFFL